MLQAVDTDFSPANLASVVDHLRAVEITHVDARGNVNTTIATNDPSDPAYDLWWAHTGGGGGNFGIVTRYWFHTPNTERGLVEPPSTVLVRAIDFAWNALDENRFKRLLTNYSTGMRRTVAPARRTLN